MIFQIGHPVIFLGMALGFVIAVLVHNLAQTVAARVLHDATARMSRRGLLDPKREFEPFGIIAMIIGGLGWGQPVPLTEPRTRGGRKGRYIATLLMGPLADVLVGLGCLVAFALATSRASFDSPTGQHVLAIPNVGYELLGLIGVMCVALGVLHVIPLPPLDGARVMWALAPPTAGWQRARYNMEEQNWGLGALVILSLPLFSGTGLVVRVTYAMAQPLIDAVIKAFAGG
ncbi:MAG: M50 family metallopeptidase [Actinomycetota bacterium]